MNLEEFVAESLSQIAKGVAKAQQLAAETGALINPEMRVTNSTHTLGEAEGYGGQVLSYVDFDVAVTTTDATGTKGGIGVAVGVLALGSQGRSDQSRGSESRIQFKVPVMWPLQECQRK